jgi:hypothetical protein
MKDYSFVTREVEGSIQCGNREFPDPVPGKEKQCFCEQNNQPQVKRCASEDGSCQCNGGNVFFGTITDNEGHNPASFDDMFTYSFAVKYNVTGTVDCNKRTFAGFDPQPGFAKQCFCDDVGYEEYDNIESELAYWRE